MAIFAAKFDMVPPGIQRSTGFLGDWSNTGMINSTDLDQFSKYLDFTLSYHSVKTVKPMVDTLASVAPLMCGMRNPQFKRSMEFAVFAYAMCQLLGTSAVNPNIQYDYDIVLGPKINRDGIPMHDSVEAFIRTLTMGLGQVSIDGFTLLSTVMGSDAAGYDPATAQPHYLFASTQQKNQHAKRNMVH